MTKVTRVLSLDGGGVRGVIPALVLAKIEEIAGKPCSELFDLIVGTSTGGIIALGLTIPGANGQPRYSAADLTDIYVKEGKRLFSRSVWHRIHSADGWVDEKYPSDGIEGVLYEYFGDATLKESLVDLVITSYELETRMPFFFKTRNARDREEEGYNFLMRDVARATSAAPTYFEPALLGSKRSRTGRYGLIDGGVYVNNPGMCAYVEAITRFKERDPILLSLGTGIINEPIDYKKAKDWGRAGWAVPILDTVFDAVADTVNYQLEKLLGTETYFRFQPELKKENTPMDDASQKNINSLVDLARSLVEVKKDQLERAVELLIK